MLVWFHQLTAREQIMLMVLVAVFSVLLFWRAVLAPLAEARADAESSLSETIDQLARVEVKVSQLLALRELDQSKKGASLSSLLNVAATNAGLQIKRLQPNRRGEVELRFENIDSDALLSFLQTIESGQSSMRIIDASIANAGTVGDVNATLRIRGE